jgi:hypothetical protein
VSAAVFGHSMPACQQAGRWFSDGRNAKRASARIYKAKASAALRNARRDNYCYQNKVNSSTESAISDRTRLQNFPWQAPQVLVLVLTHAPLISTAEQYLAPSTNAAANSCTCWEVARYVPSGLYVLAGNLTVLPGVTLRGTYSAPPSHNLAITCTLKEPNTSP